MNLTKLGSYTPMIVALALWGLAWIPFLFGILWLASVLFIAAIVSMLIFIDLAIRDFLRVLGAVR